MNALIAKERYHFHERLFETNTLTLTKAGWLRMQIQVAGDQKQ